MISNWHFAALWMSGNWHEERKFSFLHFHDSNSEQPHKKTTIKKKKTKNHKIKLNSVCFPGSGNLRGVCEGAEFELIGYVESEARPAIPWCLPAAYYYRLSLLANPLCTRKSRTTAKDVFTLPGCYVQSQATITGWGNQR
jgi:hypothetical protein